MIPSNPICQVCDYGSSATYRELPSEEQIRCGVIPLDSLPAAWWNCMWNMTNSAINQARGAVGVLIDEVNTVLDRAGVCVCDTCVDQLYRSIDKISQIVGTAARAGSVKSSSTCGEVSINEQGIMTANGLGNAAQLTTTAHTVVGAINELKSTYDTNFGNVNTALEGKAPTSHASSANTYGVGSADNYGHLKISDTYTSVLSACSGVAASQKALTCVYCYAAGVAAAALGLGNTAGCALGTAAAGSATTAARSDHVHPLPAITSLSGTLGIANGGTGATTAANARTCLGLGSAATCAASAFLGASATAVNSTCFAGCTYACAKADIRNYTPTNATNATNADKGLCGTEYKSFGTAAFAATTSFRSSTWMPTASDVGAAPTSHASTTTDYGVGSATSYGHLKVCDTYTASSSAAAANGVAASQCAVYAAYTAARNFGNTAPYAKYVCTAAGEAGAADCTVVLGSSRSYRWSSCPTNICSFDRRTYMKVGTYQCQNCCAGYAYLDVCNWQCCYSGTAGVTTCSNKRYYFKSDGYFLPPEGVCGSRIYGKNATFGCALIADRLADTGSAAVTFARCGTVLGHIGMSAVGGALSRFTANGAASYQLLDTSAAVTVAQGGTGATTAANARTNLGLGTAAVCAATAFLASNGCAADSAKLTGKAPSALCVACAGKNGSGTAFGAAATRGVFTRTTVGDIGWGDPDNRTKVVDVGAMAYWDGAYQNTSSNLRYFCGGAFGSAAAKTAGPTAGNVPLLGSNLGTTNNNIVVTDTAGALKPSGITVGTAAGCAATAFLASNGCAADSAKLGGSAASCYLLKTGCAADSAKLGGQTEANLCVGCAGMAYRLGTAHQDACVCMRITCTSTFPGGACGVTAYICNKRDRPALLILPPLCCVTARCLTNIGGSAYMVNMFTCLKAAAETSFSVGCVCGTVACISKTCLPYTLVNGM